MNEKGRRHKNADKATGTKLTFPGHVSSAGGICSTCIRDGLCEIGKRCRTGQTLFPEPFGISQFGAEKYLPNMDDVQILPELYGKSVNFHEVEVSKILGGFRVSSPIVVAGMGSTKVASDLWKPLSEGAARAGIPLVLGENIFSTFGEKAVEERIKTYLKHYDGKHGAVIVQGNGIEIKAGIFELAKKFGAHGIEIKLGQGAKQNLGGEIKFQGADLAKKYRAMGYHVFENADGSYQRHSPVYSLSFASLKEVVFEAEKAGLPIWVKVAVGAGIINLLDDLKKLAERFNAPIKAITIDGHGGGTGMSPWLIMNETSLPSAVVFSAIKKKYPFDIILAGGYTDGVDISKALMLGAKGVAMGRSFIIAANAEKHPEAIQGKMEVDSGKGLENYVKALEQEISMVCAVQRVDNVSELKDKKKNLFALSEIAGNMFGINFDAKRVL